MFVLTFSWLQFQTLFLLIAKVPQAWKKEGLAIIIQSKGCILCPIWKLNCQMLYCNLCEVIESAGGHSYTVPCSHYKMV